MGGSRGGEWELLTPTGKSQVAIGFFRNIGTDLNREAIGPHRSNCFLREVCMVLWKKVDNLLNGPPDGLF